MYRSKQKQAFTLIELLMVIAIIGILAGILIPTVGAVRKQANIAASKSQLSNYVTAITLFKGEYGYYPFPSAQTNNGVNVNSLTSTEDFIETLSGRNSSNAAVQTGGNRRSIAFHSFSESEFFLNDDDTIDDSTLADRFNNTNIFIVIDDDGDNEVTVPKTDGSNGTIDVKTPVTAYVTANAEDAPAYYLYD